VQNYDASLPLERQGTILHKFIDDMAAHMEALPQLYVGMSPEKISSFTKKRGILVECLEEHLMNQLHAK